MAAEQAAINAQDLWFAEAKEFGEDNIAGGGMVEEGDGGGGGRFINNEDPGLPAGAQCESSTKYKKAHPQLCHEIESNPWEPADALCIMVGWTNPVTAYPCGAYGAIREATKHHHP
jgi:hypothetical protein